MDRTALLLFAAALGVLLVAAPATAQDQDPTPANEWIDSTYEMRFVHVPGGAPNDAGGPAQSEVDAVVRLHEFQYDGDTYTADDFREAYDKGFIGDQAVAELEAEVRSNFKSTLEQVLPLEGGANAGPANLTDSSLQADYDGSPYQPPLVVTVSGGGDLNLTAVTGADADPKEVGVALDLGATFELPLNMQVPDGRNLTAEIHAPAGLAWTAAPGATIESDGAVAVHDQDNWKGTSALLIESGLDLTDPDEKAYAEEDVSIDADVDLKGLDVQLTRIPGGSLGEGNGKVDIRGELAVVELPSSAPQVLVDAGVTHVSAADVRLLLAEDIVDRSTVADRVENLTSGFAGETPDQVDVLLSGGLVPTSLEGNGSAEDETAKPLKLHFTADVTADLAFQGQGGGAAQGIVLHTMDRTVPFKSLKGYPTSWEVVMPKGVSLEDVQVEGAEPTLGTTDDGRDFMALDVGAGESHDVVMTAGFNVSLLWHQTPEILALLLLLLLLPILLVARLVRGGSDEEEPTRVQEPPHEREP